jgi:hypothetical protein
MDHPGRQATVNGADFAYFSADTRWTVDGQLLHSDVNSVTGQGAFADINYRPTRGVQHSIIATYLDKTLDINDVGYVQRNDHQQLDYRLSITESGLEKYRSRTRGMNIVNQWNADGRPVRLGLFFNQSLTYLNNTSLNTSFRYFPPRVDDRLSRGNGTYKIPHRLAYDFSWSSDRSRPFSYGFGIGNAEEDLKANNINYSVNGGWQPSDRFSTNFTLSYRDRESWLVHRGGTRMTTYTATEWSPQLNASFFISAKQQFRIAVQWTGIQAKEDRFFQIDQRDVRHLTEVSKPNLTSDNFTVSRMSFQARYRWEIAPLSDLFVVYTRGSNLPSTGEAEFQDLLFDSWSQRVSDTWVVKLRYRLGG